MVVRTVLKIAVALESNAFTVALAVLENPSRWKSMPKYQGRPSIPQSCRPVAEADPPGRHSRDNVSGRAGSRVVD